MVLPVGSQLSNMEFMLYGGLSGANANCPSYANGYRAGNYFNYYNNFYNPYMFNNGLTQDIFSYQNPNNVSFQGNNSQVSSGNGTDGQSFGATAKDLEVLEKYYLKGLNPTESLGGAATGGLMFGLMNNFRFLAHPYNSLKSIAPTNKMFADYKVAGSKLNKLWINPDTQRVITDAYRSMHKLQGATESRLGLFKSRIKVDSDTYKTLTRELKKALERGDAKEIATVSEKIKVATGAKTGWLPQLWGKIRGQAPKTPLERINAKGAVITDNVGKNITEFKSKTFGQQLSHQFKGQGLKGGALWCALEFGMDLLSGNIQAAFEKDTSTGMKQLGQTTVKAAGSFLGWTAGEAVGVWAGAKIGAMAGTAIAPGVGTLIGALAGVVGGSIGCALMGKVTHSLVGESVGEKAKVEKMKKTPQGVAQLLQLTAGQAQSDKNLDPRVLQALQNVSAACA